MESFTQAYKLYNAIPDMKYSSENASVLFKRKWLKKGLIFLSKTVAKFSRKQRNYSLLLHLSGFFVIWQKNTSFHVNVKRWMYLG